MSSEQITLSADLRDRRDKPGDGPATQQDAEGARTRTRDDSVRDSVRSVGTPDDAGQCRRCGSEVEAQLQRVIGDNHGRVDACSECAQSDGVEWQSTARVAIATRRGAL
jgi:hypothetical protein